MRYRRGGNDGHVLTHERVEQGRLARIAPPEQTDMQAQGLGTFVHAELLHAGRRSCRTTRLNLYAENPDTEATGGDRTGSCLQPRSRPFLPDIGTPRAPVHAVIIERA